MSRTDFRSSLIFHTVLSGVPAGATIASHPADLKFGIVSAAAGMGKRTLVDVLAARVGSAGGTVLRGVCDESERSLYLQPLVEVVRTLLLARPPAAARELSGRTRFATPEPVTIGQPGAGPGQRPGGGPGMG